MNERDSFSPERRRFLSNLPATAAICIGCSQTWALAISAPQEQTEQNIHKFQSEMPPVTYSRFMQYRHNKYIGILKRLKEEIGEEKLLQLLKKASYAENVALGERLSDRIDSMRTFGQPFRDENSGVGHTIVREIIEDNDTAFEMKVTECLTEQIFREAGALDLGYACVCHADFGLTEGMDIDIKLTRSKTLMQGDDCCDHRYVLQQ